jgi:hypothetical protein
LVPVIRKESNSEAAKAVPATFERKSPPPAGDIRTPPKAVAPPPQAADLQAVVDNAVEAVKSALSEHSFKAQTRLVRGLEALDQREQQRETASQEAVEAAIRELSGAVYDLRHEMRLVDRSARRQVDDLSGRLNSALDGMVEILRYMKSEIAAIHYSLDASRSEALLESSRTAGEETS